MGEAKRRKLSGSHPSGGPVEDFRVPGGKVAITVDVQGEDPSTVMFDADKIADMMKGVEQVIGRSSYYPMVRGLAAEFAACKRKGADITGVGIGILWSALYHPRSGKEMREGVSRDLREKGRAHITWQVTDDGLAMSLADQFVDMGNLVAAAPGPFTVSQIHDDTKPN